MALNHFSLETTTSPLYDKYIKRLLCANDETKTQAEHDRIVIEFNGWKRGVEDTKGYQFNGDYYYIDLFSRGKLKERPICCGVFLDWESKAL